MISLFLTCAPGLEPFLLDEALAIGLTNVQIVAGGARADSGLPALYRANLELGLAQRVLVRLGGFQARRATDLIAGVAAAGDEAARWIVPGRPLLVRVTSSRSKLRVESLVAQHVRKALETHLGGPLPAPPESGASHAEGHQSVFVRLADNRVTLFADTSGRALHYRGYRPDDDEASLRPDLARGLLRAVGWAPDAPLIDPFCGSGTVGVEGDWLARGVPPGSQRSFAFVDAPCFDAPLWERLRAEALARISPSRSAPILLSDRDEGAIEAAAGNAERAGAAVSIERASLGHAAWIREPPPGVGVVASHPPSGGDKSTRVYDLRPLYQSLGRHVRAALPVGTRVALAIGDRLLARELGIFLRARALTHQGGPRLTLMVGETTPRAEG